MTLAPGIDVEAFYNLASIGTQPISFLNYSSDVLNPNMSRSRSHAVYREDSKAPLNTARSGESTLHMMQPFKDEGKCEILASEEMRRGSRHEEVKARTTLHLKSMRWWYVSLHIHV